MAWRSYFGLLSEIEEVSTCGQGKVPSLDDWTNDCNDWFNEGVEGGLPSQCVSDGMLSQALFGDPLLPLLDEDALTCPPPAIPPPETLIQVSLPAGHAAVPGPASAVPLPRPPSPHHTTSPREVSSPTPSSSEPSAAPCSKPPALSSSVRVVVRTGNMVAPVNPEKSSRYLVRIPGPASPSATAAPRLHSLQEEEKSDPDTPATPKLEEPQTEEATSNTVSRVPTPVTTTTTTTSIPFRSLQGGARQGRCSKRKAYELDPQNDPDMERCRLNAVNARRNREMKKLRMTELERRVEEGNRERDRLLGENRQLREGMARLQRQVGHLTSVLRNDSSLSTILDKVSPARVSLGDSTALPEEEEQGEDLPGGVCLHLDGKEATLEFCSLCAKKASKKLRWRLQVAQGHPGRWAGCTPDPPVGQGAPATPCQSQHPPAPRW
ncbi:CREB/ATF bZIP transcription factor [Chionoecetes opilio]|uniref:CREB/ATF bZIP transcription factor n=1 Tax=Chionoecetes opilio TaxID=41210 RepID=A0A8J4YU36_CHIOP|nr:CREB/ATF bZIP transcription factor [Chionoecetes opilio]